MAEGEVRPNKKVVLRNYVNGFPQESDKEVATDTVQLEVPRSWMDGCNCEELVLVL